MTYLGEKIGTRSSACLFLSTSKHVVLPSKVDLRKCQETLSPLSHSACCSSSSSCGVRWRQGLISTAFLSLCRMIGELGFDFWHVYIFSSKSRPGWLWDQQSLLSNAYREFISLVKLAGVWNHISTPATSSWRGA